MHIKITRRSVPTWPEPSPLLDVVVQLSMLTLTPLPTMSKDAEQFPPNVLLFPL